MVKRQGLNTLLTSQPVVLLTGAGASVALGKATTYDIYDSSGYQQRSELGVLRDFRDWLRTKHTDDPIDLEFLLDEIQRLNRSFDELREIPQYQGHMNNLQGERKRFDEAYEQCLDFMVDYYGTIDGEAAAALYQPMFDGLMQLQGARRKNAKIISMFTLNYDEAIERAGNHMSAINVVDGFHGIQPPQWHRRVFDDLRSPQSGATVALFKLHGSVSWTRPANSESIEKTYGMPRRQQGREHAILYPTQKAKRNDVEPYATAYEYLGHCLARVRVALVIGCSFRDVELRELIQRRIRQPKPFSLLAVDPGVNNRELADRLEIPQKHIFTKTYGFEESAVPKILAHISELLHPVAE